VDRQRLYQQCRQQCEVPFRHKVLWIAVPYSAFIDFVTDAAGISVSAGNNVISGNNFGITSGSRFCCRRRPFPTGWKYMSHRHCCPDVPRPAPSIAPVGIVPVYSSINTIQPANGCLLRHESRHFDGELERRFPKVPRRHKCDHRREAAYLSFVSSGQINAQAPDDTSAGPVPVVVTTKGGTVSSTVTLPDLHHRSSCLTASMWRASSSERMAGAYAEEHTTSSANRKVTWLRNCCREGGDSLELFAVGLDQPNQP